GATFGQVEELDQTFLLLQVVKQHAQPVDILRASQPVQEICTTANDQLVRLTLLVTAGPDGKTALHEVAGKGREFALHLILKLRKLPAQFDQRLPRQMRIEEIGGLGKLRRGDARRQVDNPVLDLVVFSDK